MSFLEGNKEPDIRPRGVGESAKWDSENSRWISGEYWFDEKSAQAAVDFFPKYIRFTSAEWSDRQFFLEDWQQDEIIRPVFGWKRKDGTRRFRRCFVWVPRKNGKTELAAGIALLLLIGDAEPAAEIYSIASDKQQAEIVFNKAISMVGKSSGPGELADHLECFKTSIYSSELNASFKPLSGSGKGKHGMAASGLVGDEIHEWKNGELYQFMHDSESARRQPLEFMISTAGTVGGYGSEVWEECEKILDGSVEDKETLVVIFAADIDDDWTDENTWYKANPNLGISKKLETMRTDANRARQSPRLENFFKAYHLNIWSEQSVRWLPIDRIDDTGKKLGWKYCEGPTNWRDLEFALRGKFCYTGIDLSAIADLTALVHYFPAQVDIDTPTVLCRFFKPQDLIEEHTKRDRLSYDLWAKNGALFATPGNVVDYAFLKKSLYDDAERFDIRGIGVDRYNATQTTIEIAQEGLPIEYFQQGFLSMSPPSKELERLVISNGLRHGGHPILYRHARAVAVETDPAGNIKPTKSRSTERIDGIVALVEAIGMSSNDNKHHGKLTSDKVKERGGLI
jgi:phage terminase large subunit-like protein